MIQSTKAGDTDSDERLGATAASVYEGLSGDIVNTLNDMLDKATAQLNDARKTETVDLQNFQPILFFFLTSLRLLEGAGDLKYTFLNLFQNLFKKGSTIQLDKKPMQITSRQ